MPFDANEYNARYKREKYEQVQLRVPKGYREKIAEQADARSMSMNKYLMWLIEKDREDALAPVILEEL